jgi:hypothetical protein
MQVPASAAKALRLFRAAAQQAFGFFTAILATVFVNRHLNT